MNPPDSVGIIYVHVYIPDSVGIIYVCMYIYVYIYIHIYNADYANYVGTRCINKS